MKPGDPSSGLLPGIDPSGPGEEGKADTRVQTYNLRIAATEVRENRRAWPKPADYDPLQYELLLRNFEAGDHRVPWSPTLMPNRKTDANNNFAVSTDFIGQNYDYPNGDYRTRERIIAAHLSYTKGLFWTLANSPRVPDKIRLEFDEWGLAKDEFLDNDNWPHQLYVREARRMVSDYVMTQHNCQGGVSADDAVGLAAYTMDSHNVQRYVVDGRVLNEGDVQVGGFPPYPISYRSIVPKESECSNLFVPVCLSATHIAYGSIRMEPVFMVLGQSSATAACQAIDGGVAVQRIEYDAPADGDQDTNLKMRSVVRLHKLATVHRSSSSLVRFLGLDGPLHRVAPGRPEVGHGERDAAAVARELRSLHGEVPLVDFRGAVVLRPLQIPGPDEPPAGSVSGQSPA